MANTVSTFFPSFRTNDFEERKKMKTITKIRCTPVKKLFPPEFQDELDFSIVRYRVEGSAAVPGDSDCFTATGALLPCSKNAEVELRGTWVLKDGKPQLEVERHKAVIPQTQEAVLAFLESLDHVSVETAYRLYNHFGKQTLTVLDNDINAALEVMKQGYSFAAFARSYRLRRDCSDAFQYLKSLRADSKIAVEVALTAKTMGALLEDPFLFALDGTLPYRLAVKIAKKNGLSMQSGSAIKAAMLDVMKCVEGQSSGIVEGFPSGGTYLPYDILMKQTSRLTRLSEQDEELRKAFAGNILAKRLVIKDGWYIYRAVTAAAEYGIAHEVRRIVSVEPQQREYKESIYAAENQHRMLLAPEQRNAVKAALTHAITIITGGPGTGKTAIEKMIISVYRMYNDRPVLLMAPTGKAARRMSECTGEVATTIHKALGVNAGAEVVETDKTLDAGLIIVDEASMLDSQLSYALLKAVETGTQLLLVGDTCQLPSIGCGNVLAELVCSGVLPVVKLETVYRQKEGSIIARNCARVRAGFTELESAEDFSFIHPASDEDAADLAVKTYEDALKAGYRPKDICVLTSMRRKTITGVNQLNPRLQKCVIADLKHTPSLKYGQNKVFYLGDHIISMVNSEAVSNGDVGVIVKMDNSKFVADFGDGRILSFNKRDMRSFELAYANTIHKSQGSQWPFCIILVSESHESAMNRNIIYTGLSRAEQKVILIGSELTIADSISEDATRRSSRLSNLLQNT